MTTWSYSSIKLFDQCPKKYYHLRVAKDVVDDAGPAAAYGTDVHKAAEDHVRDGKPIPAKYKFMVPIVEALTAIPGEKHAELKLGVKRTDTGYEPCGFFDEGVWWRGVADIIIDAGETLYLADYKTGKNTRYADTKQLDLLAGAAFCHFPHVKRVKAALVYVVTGEFIDRSYVPSDLNNCMSVFAEPLHRLEGALESGVWNANESGLCGWCPVKSCPSWRQRRN